jgi:hypothetical protein
LDSRESFVALFGEEQAVAIERAAAGHRGFLLEGKKRGSDPFRDAIVICIGCECMTRFREDHGISASESRLKDWVRKCANLAQHDGPIDYLCLCLGMYDSWMRADTEKADA